MDSMELMGKAGILIGTVVDASECRTKGLLKVRVNLIHGTGIGEDGIDDKKLPYVKLTLDLWEKCWNYYRGVQETKLHPIKLFPMDSYSVIGEEKTFPDEEEEDTASGDIKMDGKAYLWVSAQSNMSEAIADVETKTADTDTLYTDFATSITVLMGPDTPHNHLMMHKHDMPHYHRFKIDNDRVNQTYIRNYDKNFEQGKELIKKGDRVMLAAIGGAQQTMYVFARVGEYS